MTPSMAQRLATKLAKRPPRTTPAGRKVVWICQLLKRRKELNLTLRDVSGGTGVSIAVLSAIQHGTDPMLTTARAIAGFFGCSVEDMWPVKHK